MRRSLGVANEHHLVAHPAFAADARNVSPDGAVGYERVALQLPRKHALAEAGSLLFREIFKAGARERLRIGFNDDRGMVRLVLIAVGDEDSVLGLPEEEVEGVEWPCRSEPGEEIRPQADCRLECIGKGVAEARVGAIRNDYEIGVQDGGIERRDLGLELDLSAQRAGAPP